ncbi:MAG: hypothetical protein AMJ78_01200 [Omnitrophica WOR_2 bacterium SM23_29]|nr:MAG: hypothetical protein AMJ78_01200 [Omnitrophica WOR_2 bacterium SM23_29]
MVWSGINKRRFVRAVFECVVKVKKKGTPLIFQTHTENISIGGVCVILERGLFRGTAVEVEIFLPDDFPPIRCDGRVVWALKREGHAERKPSQYDTGIEFTEISDENKGRIEHIILELLKY